MIQKVDLTAAARKLAEPYMLVELTRVEEFAARLFICQGGIAWHKHIDEDELFFVYRGKVRIEVKEHRDIELCSGEMAMIPRNVEHRPVSAGPSYVLMFEPLQLKSKGD